MANDVYFDSTCKAAYLFESGYLATDSQSSNHLAAHNNPTASSADYKEGLCAANLAKSSAQYFHLLDANLATDFPLKWDDDPAVLRLASRVFSCCFWIKFATTTGRQSIVGKYNSASAARSFLVYSQDGNLRLAWGYNEGTSEHVLIAGVTFNTSIWYHVGVSIDNDEQIAIFEVWDDSSKVVACRELKEFILDSLAITPASFTVGADHNGQNCLDAKLDELLVFNVRKSPVEYALLRHGNYTGPRANCFFFDPNCVSEYSFELDPGGLIDTFGLNNLTDFNTVNFDAGPVKEQGRSLYLDRTQLEYAQRTDANLSASFPLKSGSVSSDFSICFWIRQDTRSWSYGDNYIVSKSSSTNGQRSFGVYITSSGTLYFYWGYNSGNSSTTISTGLGLTLDRWYHVGISVSGGSSGTPTILCRVYDGVQQKVVLHSLYYPSNALSIGSGSFSIGTHANTSNTLYGWIDECVIFKDLKSKFEIDAIRNGSYFRPLRWGSVECTGLLSPYVPTDTMKVISDGLVVPYVPTDTMKILSCGLMCLIEADLYKVYTNTFVGDPNVVAVYTFENSPGFENDQLGLNDLTNIRVQQVE